MGNTTQTQGPQEVYLFRTPCQGPLRELSIEAGPAVCGTSSFWKKGKKIKITHEEFSFKSLVYDDSEQARTPQNASFVSLPQRPV